MTQMDLATVSILITIFATVASLTWWLSAQFKEVRKLVYEQVEQLRNFVTAKIEAHEEKDAYRFNAMTNDIWGIKLRNAQRDGMTIIEKPSTK